MRKLWLWAIKEIVPNHTAWPGLPYTRLPEHKWCFCADKIHPESASAEQAGFQPLDPHPLSRKICTTVWDCPKNFTSKPHALWLSLRHTALKRESKLKESTCRCFCVLGVREVMIIYKVKENMDVKIIFKYFYILFLSWE